MLVAITAHTEHAIEHAPRDGELVTMVVKKQPERPLLKTFKNKITHEHVRCEFDRLNGRNSSLQRRTLTVGFYGTFCPLVLAAARCLHPRLNNVSPGGPTWQYCWCLSFRKWARDAGLLWFPALLLGGTSVCLGGAHHVLRGALAAGSMSTLQYALVHLPVRYKRVVDYSRFVYD